MNRSNPASDASMLAQTSDVVFERTSASSLGSSVGVSVAVLSAARDSLRVLSAFAWGKESRLSKNKSAQLCDLMDAWN